MNLKSSASISLLVVLALSGCQQEQPSDATALLEKTPASTEMSQSQTSVQPQKMSGAASILHATFDALECGKPANANLTWQIASPDSMPVKADLWVGPEESRKLVASSVNSGEVAIPGWAMPGQLFTLRSEKEEILDQITLPGIACE